MTHVHSKLAGEVAKDARRRGRRICARGRESGPPETHAIGTRSPKNDAFVQRRSVMISSTGFSFLAGADFWRISGGFSGGCLGSGLLK